MTVRQVSNHGQNITGSFPSIKNGQPVQYESTIERDLLYVLEYDRTVVRYTMQPLVITGSDADGVVHRYTPDVLVERTTRPELIECKPAARLTHPHTQQQLNLGQEWAELHDYDFALITDVDLRTGPRLANLKLLWRYSRLAVSHIVTERCLTLLASNPTGIPFYMLQEGLKDTVSPLAITPCLYSLIFQHVLFCDLNQPLDHATLVWRNFTQL